MFGWAIVDSKGDLVGDDVAFVGGEGRTSYRAPMIFETRSLAREFYFPPSEKIAKVKITVVKRARKGR
jgi:hypothetical protein